MGEGPQQNSSRVDGMQKLIALKEAEINALKIDLGRNTQVLQESRSALEQYQKLMDRQNAIDAVISASSMELKKELETALARAKDAEAEVARLKSQNQIYEQLLDRAKVDMLDLWESFRRGAERRAAVTPPPFRPTLSQ